MGDSVIGTLSKVSGIRMKELGDMLKEVQINHARLDMCEGPHAFYPIPNSEDKLIRKYKCIKCEGIVDFTQYNWYLKGLAHGMALSTPKGSEVDSVR